MSITQSGDMTAAFSEALSSASTPAPDASPASDTAPVSTSAEPAAPAATTQAAEGEQAPDTVNTEASKSEKEKGIRLPNGTWAPPESRWPDIIENQRKVAAEEAEARVRQEVEQQYQWAKEIAEHERDGLLTWRAAMYGDPRAIAHIKANPQALEWLRGLVTEPQQSAPDPEPEPDLQLPDGTLVYSAQQLAKREAWREKQLEQRFEAQFKQRFQPVEQVIQAHSRATAHAEVASVLAKFTADPAFVTHKADVAKVIASDQRLSALADRDPELALETAWHRVYREKVLPSQQQKTEADVLANLQQRAAAGTVNPSTPTVSAPKKFQPGTDGFVEALRHYAGTAG